MANEPKLLLYLKSTDDLLTPKCAFMHYLTPSAVGPCYTPAYLHCFTASLLLPVVVIGLCCAID